MTDYEKKNVTRGGGGGQKSAEKVSRIIWMAPNIRKYIRLKKYRLIKMLHQICFRLCSVGLAYVSLEKEFFLFIIE
jgi:hypothetical protein